MRKYISTNLLNQKYYNDMVVKHDSEIKVLQESFSKLENKKIINEIYFDGQIYDAYSKIMDIILTSKNELIIIDGYADRVVLDMIKRLSVKVILITKLNGKLTDLDIKKYNEQYKNLKIIYNDSFHDRYFIIDKDTIYHCGASINYAGTRTFSINKLEDEVVKKSLLEKINIISLY